MSSVTDRITDKIWDAVRDAVSAGWSPQMFKDELAPAWEEACKDDIKTAKEVFSK